MSRVVIENPANDTSFTELNWHFRLSSEKLLPLLQAAHTIALPERAV